MSDEFIATMNQTYEERDRCVALIAKMAVALGFPAGLGRHEGGEWDDEWRNIVYIELPAGQVSWHIHDKELPLFEDLPQYEKPWDGHTTQEKYQRCTGSIEFEVGRGFPPRAALRTLLSPFSRKDRIAIITDLLAEETEDPTTRK